MGGRRGGALLVLSKSELEGWGQRSKVSKKNAKNVQREIKQPGKRGTRE